MITKGSIVKVTKDWLPQLVNKYGVVTDIDGFHDVFVRLVDVYDNHLVHRHWAFQLSQLEEIT